MVYEYIIFICIYIYIFTCVCILNKISYQEWLIHYDLYGFRYVFTFILSFCSVSLILFAYVLGFRFCFYFLFSFCWEDL